MSGETAAVDADLTVLVDGTEIDTIGRPHLSTSRTFVDLSPGERRMTDHTQVELRFHSTRTGTLDAGTYHDVEVRAAGQSLTFQAVLHRSEADPTLGVLFGPKPGDGFPAWQMV